MKHELICHDCGTRLQRNNSQIKGFVKYERDVCCKCSRIKAVTDIKNFGLEVK